MKADGQSRSRMSCVAVVILFGGFFIALALEMKLIEFDCQTSSLMLGLLTERQPSRGAHDDGDEDLTWRASSASLTRVVRNQLAR